MSAIDELATELSRLPGIGRKTALRLTYHLLRQPPEQSRRLADALGGLVRSRASLLDLRQPHRGRPVRHLRRLAA